MKKLKKQRVLYEPEDDVLNIWLSEKPYDYAEDENGVIIHYTKNREPVYVEILAASRFLGKDISFYKKIIKSDQSSVAIPHRVK